ncbi:hypothetical protein G7Y89_g747 [Cudoniella acicularis]|uniref:Uncharacterized protein n=1 Tax=Cudoniella acicularis TaxID=354080 RepID=A0A8H4W821_9HELO|nr:hypothetical protein G7Y89_g747 [Cudoniella acicularis]
MAPLLHKMNGSPTPHNEGAIATQHTTNNNPSGNQVVSTTRATKYDEDDDQNDDDDDDLISPGDLAEAAILANAEAQQEPERMGAKQHNFSRTHALQGASRHAHHNPHIAHSNTPQYTSFQTGNVHRGNFPQATGLGPVNQLMLQNSQLLQQKFYLVHQNTQLVHENNYLGNQYNYLLRRNHENAQQEAHKRTVADAADGKKGADRIKKERGFILSLSSSA